MNDNCVVTLVSMVAIGNIVCEKYTLGIKNPKKLLFYMSDNVYLMHMQLLWVNMQSIGRL